MIIVTKHTNFGSRKTGLSTVGYKLLNEDNTEKQARTTSGVTEWIAGTGIYGASISFDDGWRGLIVWDTGEATPIYTADCFNYLEFTAQGGGGAIVVQGEFLSRAEKEALLAAISSISKAIAAQDKRSARIEQGISDLGTVVAGLAESRSVKKFAEKISSVAGEITEKVEEDLKGIDLEAINETISVLQESVKNVKKEVELVVKIAAKLISIEDLKTILKEGGVRI